MSHTLSFTILDDLYHMLDHGPVHVILSDLNIGTIRKGVREISKLYTSYKKDDVCGYFQDSYDENEVTNDLHLNGYYVCNQFQKYYVIAFAIDCTRFEVYSKDCNKELIDW